MSKKQSNNRYTPASYKKTNGPGAAANSLRKKKALIISLIAFVVIAVLVVTLVLALWKETIPKDIESTRTDGEASTLEITNSDFSKTYAEGQNLQYPLTANGWTKLDSIVESATLMGVVDTKEDEWNGKVIYDLASKGLSLTNPSYPVADSENSRIFMISNARETAANVLSSSFSLASSQYLKVSVWIKTQSITGHGAYLAVKTSNSLSTLDYYATRLENIVTDGEWKEYSFYVEGAKNSSQTLYLEMGLGQTDFAENPSLGTAFFAEITCEKISKGLFLNNNVEEKTENAEHNGFYIGHSFDSTDAEESDQTLTVGNTIGNVSYLTYDEYKTQFELLPFAEKDGGTITKISNVSDKTAGITYSSFTVNPPSINKSYRLSVWVRTENVAKNTGAYLYLFDKTNDATHSKTSYFEKVNTPSDIEKDTFNGWTEYQFYVKPSNSQAIELSLEIYLGMKNYAAGSVIPSGTVYIAELALFEIEQSDYAGTSSGDTIKTIDLNQTFETDNVISNPSFNNPLSNSGLETVVRPANWTVYVSGNTAIGGDGNVAPNPIGGIQNGLLFKNNSTLLTELGITENDFPTKDDDAHSVLMLNNKVATSSGVQSAAITLSANNYYKISVIAKGINGTTPYVYLTDGRKVLLGYDSAMDGTVYTAENEDEGNGYTRYYFYVAVGNQAKTVYLELWLGNRNATAEQYVSGIALFDQAYCAPIDEEAYMKLFGKDTEGEPLENPDIVLKSSDFDKESIIMDQISVTSDYSNVSGLDFRFFEAAEADDLSLVVAQAAKVKTDADTDELAKLKTMIENFNKKYYLDSDGNLLEKGTNLIDFEKEVNFENIQEFRTYLYNLQNPAEDNPGGDTETEKEPINWIVMSSLIVTSLMLIAILILVIRKIKPHKNKQA